MAQHLRLVVFASSLLGSFVFGCTPLHKRTEETVLATDGHKPPPDPPEAIRSPYAATVEKSDAQGGSINSGEIRQLGHSTHGAGIPAVPDDPTGQGRNPPDWPAPVLPHPLDPGRSPPEEPVVIAIHHLMNQKPQEAVEAIKRYSKPNQEALLLLLPWAALFAETDLDHMDPDQMAKFLEQMEEFGRKLRPRAKLALGHVCFCLEVEGFGMINPLPPGHVFQAGNDGRSGEPIFLYVEVANFASQPAGPFYETRLAGKLEILNARQECVWRQVFPAKLNASVSPRHDYFIIFRFAVPANLAPGQYTLAMQLTDQTGLEGRNVPPHRSALRKLPFEIAAENGERVPTRAAEIRTPTSN